MQTQSDLKFKNGLKDGLPIGLGYLSVSFAFGVKASLMGIPVFLSVLISMTNLTSAGQLAGLEVIASLGSFLEIALMQAVINSRYFLMSLTLTQKTDDSFTFPKRLFLSAFITDEIFAVAAAKPQKTGTRYFYGLILLPYIGWAFGTFAGALLGNVLPERITLALGIALYAMFTAIIVPPSLTNKGILFTVLLSAALSCAFYYLPFLSGVSEGMSIIICAVAASFAAAAIFPVGGTDKDNSATGGDNAENPRANPCACNGSGADSINVSNGREERDTDIADNAAKENNDAPVS